VIHGLPTGNIELLGAVVSLALAGSGADANLGDTWSGDFGIGTTPADDGTITAGDVDIIGSTAVGPASGEAISAVKANNVTAALLDNTGGGLEVNLNVLIDDADISGDGVPITCTGSLHLAYAVLGNV